jgi:peptide/nickel transport system substrate-binding protein
MRRTALWLTAALSLLSILPRNAVAEPRHAIAMQGEPALPGDFTHFGYADPNAPKGGEITYCVVGTFDNLNPFILKSLRTTARGVIDTIFGNLVFEPLMQRNMDEAFSLYGLLAESVEMDDERKWIEFHLDPNARWSDGQPVTPEDVLFTYDVFTEKGRPPYSDRMKRVEKLEKTGERSVRFTFNEHADREFPLIIAATPIVPKHFFDKESFDRGTLKPVTGSGPYLIEQVVPGQRIVFRRNQDYWGKDIPTKRGFDNFDRITIEYFLNATAQFEAFKKGICTAYAGPLYTGMGPLQVEREFDFPAAKDGRVTVRAYDLGIPPVVNGFLFNTRLYKFADPTVRRALGMLYDFEWANKNMFGGKLARTMSYWQGSELSALGHPASEKEKALLAPFPGRVPADVMDGTWRPPVNDGSGQDRAALKAVQDRERGYARPGRASFRLRNPHRLAGGGAAGRPLPANAGQARHRGDDPRARRRPDPVTQAALRFRGSDRLQRLQQFAVPGYRADRALGLGGGRPRGIVQPRGRFGPRRRCRHRSHAQRPRQG